MSWAELPETWTLGEGKVIPGYNSSDTSYGALNSVKDWPLVFHGVQPGIVKAGALVPDSTFLYGGHSVHYDYYAFLGVEASLEAEMEVSFPVSDRFSGARAVKVSGGDGYMLIVPPPDKMKNFVIGLKASKPAVQSKGVEIEAILLKTDVGRVADHDYLTVKEAAAILSCSDRTIRNYYGDGRLEHKKVGQRKVLITRASVDKLLEG